jgi:hypothetical protein
MYKFMESHKWLGGDKETIQKILDAQVDREGMIDYDKALKSIVTD